ncbi:MAG TPA: pilin [bacterium]|nr:pilin [bacterium]HNS34432.1 pilin [bacterium]HNW09415.1 pilin [bacterium]HNZ73622.1 pilin [bacterium]HOH67583.1 pilin [bacterium]
MTKYRGLFVLIFSLVFLFNFCVANTLATPPDLFAELPEKVPDATAHPEGSTKLPNPISRDGGNVTFEEVVNRVVQAVLGLTGVLALIAFIYGGVLWMVSRGDTGMIQKGKTMMIWAVFGIVIIFSSYALIKFVFEALMGQTTPTP